MCTASWRMQLILPAVPCPALHAGIPDAGPLSASGARLVLFSKHALPSSRGRRQSLACRPVAGHPAGTLHHRPRVPISPLGGHGASPSAAEAAAEGLRATQGWHRAHSAQCRRSLGPELGTTLTPAASGSAPSHTQPHSCGRQQARGTLAGAEQQQAPAAGVAVSATRP